MKSQERQTSSAAEIVDGGDIRSQFTLNKCYQIFSD